MEMKAVEKIARAMQDELALGGRRLPLRTPYRQMALAALKAMLPPQPTEAGADNVDGLIERLTALPANLSGTSELMHEAAAMLSRLRDERQEQDRALRITYASLTECQRELGQAEAALAEARVYERTHIENLDLLRDRAEKAEAALAEAQRVIAENADGLWYKRQAAREFELKQALAEAQRENAELREDIDRVQRIGVEAQRARDEWEQRCIDMAMEPTEDEQSNC